MYQKDTYSKILLSYKEGSFCPGDIQIFVLLSFILFSVVDHY